MRRLSVLLSFVAICACSCKSTPIGHGTSLIGLEDFDGGTLSHHDFGTVCVGQPVTVEVGATAIGQISLDVSTINVTGSSEFSFTTDAGIGTQVGAGGFFPIFLTFTPSGTGLQGGNLVVTSDDSQDPKSVSVGLTGSVSSAPPQPIAQVTCTDGGVTSETQTCGGIFFGTVPLGASVTYGVTVNNLGCSPLSLSAALSNVGDAGYSIPSTGLATSVALGQPTVIPVTFTPEIANSASTATLTLTTNALDGGNSDGGGVYVINLAGAGGAAACALSPTQWSVGTISPGQDAGQLFTVSNNGTLPVALGTPTVGGGQGFSILDAGWASGYMLPARGSANVLLGYVAPAAGNANSDVLNVPCGSIDLDAGLTANTIGNICLTDPNGALLTTSYNISGPTAGLFCGSSYGCFDVNSCDGNMKLDGGVSVVVNDIHQTAAGLMFNPFFKDAGSQTGPYTISPGMPLEVCLGYQQDGTLSQAYSVVAVDSTQAGDTSLTVYAPTQAVPRPNAIPTIDGGTTFHVGDAIPVNLFGFSDGGELENFVPYFYFFSESQTTPVPDGGFEDGGFAAVVFTPWQAAQYYVCVYEDEIDAGYGTCGIVSGAPGSLNANKCTQAFTVN